jgi:hypothetical protein
MNPIIENLRAEIARNTAVDASAVLLINGIAARVQAAVDKAIANGATAAELAPITAELAALAASNTELAAAVAANTPAEE